jgi:REP element-mobilizing transposase RayT
MSHTIRQNFIADLGELHHGRKRVQPASRTIREFYKEAEKHLQFDLLTFSEIEFGMISNCFTEVIRSFGYTCYACAIMPDHIHIVLRKHKHLAEEMIANLQRESLHGIQMLNQRHPDHPVWGGPGWKVFLNTPTDIERTIRYVEDNPIKARLPKQSFEFVTKYDGWPFHKRSR